MKERQYIDGAQRSQLNYYIFLDNVIKKFSLDNQQCNPHSDHLLIIQSDHH